METSERQRSRVGLCYSSSKKLAICCVYLQSHSQRSFYPPVTMADQYLATDPLPTVQDSSDLDFAKQKAAKYQANFQKADAEMKAQVNVENDCLAA